MLQAGDVVNGKYVIEELIGQGGMSLVYRARHRLLDSLCALKVLKPELAAVPELLRRFLNEAKAMAQFRHPNIAVVTDVVASPPALVLEHLQGALTAASVRQHAREEDLRVGAGVRKRRLRRRPPPQERQQQLVAAEQPQFAIMVRPVQSIVHFAIDRPGRRPAGRRLTTQPNSTVPHATSPLLFSLVLFYHVLWIKRA